MTTLSIPVPAQLEAFIAMQVKKGRAPNKAAVVREALLRMQEEEAVAQVLRAEQEVLEGKLLSGDLRKLAKKIR